MPEALHFLSVQALRRAYQAGDLCPVEVTERMLERQQHLNPAVQAISYPLQALAREQAHDAKQRYQRGTAGPLAGIPVSIKDTFDIENHITTYGSTAYRDNVARADSGSIRRLRAAGAVFIGKTHTAEFGQSATSENHLGEPARNPWDLDRTPGGSSGGAAASVAAGLATLALGADGGGSIRIPAAFSGLVGIKPTYGLCRNEGGFRGMSDFVCPGPLAWRVADARDMLAVLADTPFPRRALERPLRIAWCPRPEGRPVDPALLAVVAQAVGRLSGMGHSVEEVALPLAGWNEAFGPLVLDEEIRERGHLLAGDLSQLTEYVRRSLEAARAQDPARVGEARRQHAAYRERIAGLFATYDLIATPTTATTAFPLGQRPREIDGQRVDGLWGAFPFTAMFNVAGTPPMTLPCGFAGGLPVGLQLVAAQHQDQRLLDLAEDLEQALALDSPARLPQQARDRATAS